MSTITVGSAPEGVAYDAANGGVDVVNQVSGTVSVIVPPLPNITNSAIFPGWTVGTVAIIAKPNTPGDTFAVKVTSTPPSALGPGASLPSGTVTYTSGTNLSSLIVGDVVTLYEVSSADTVDASTSFTLGTTVTYDGNGASGTTPTDSTKYMVGASATVAGQGNLAKTGYTFAGWNTKADGSGTSYALGSKLTMGAANVTLYAQWRVVPSVLTPSALPNVLKGTSYSQTFQGRGGVSPYTFSITGGSLPNGLTLNPDGSLVGTPQQSGTFNFTVQIKDNAATTTTKNMSLYVIPPAPAGYLKTTSTKQVVGNSGGTLTAKGNQTTAKLVISAGTFTNPLQLDITTGTISQSQVLSGWNVVAAYGVNFDTNVSPAHPLSFTLLNQGITPQSKVYKIMGGKLVPVTATVTQGKALITFTTDPDFVVLQPKSEPVPQATKPVTGFPAVPWSTGGLLSILTGALALWWQRRKKDA